MRNILFILVSLCFFSSCRMDDSFSEDNFGMLKMNLSFDEEIKIYSRSETEEDKNAALKENSKIRIYKDGKLIDRYRKWSEMPVDGIMLPVGTGYSVLVISGDSLFTDTEGNKTAATFDASNKYYKGTKDFAIEKEKIENIDVESNIANTLVDVKFEGGWDELLSEGTVNVSVDGGALDYKWQDENPQTGYYSLPYNNPVLKCVFTGKSVSGRSFKNEYVLDAKESYRYILTYTPKDGEPIEGNEGGAFVNIKINAEPLYKKEDNVNFYQKPVITAMNGSDIIDLSQDMFVETGSAISPVFTFSGSTPLSTIVVESELFTMLGFEKNSFELISEQDILSGEELTVHVLDGGKVVTLSWNDKLNQFLNETDAKYSVKYLATDTYNTIGENNVPKSRGVIWNILVSDANVAAIPIPDEFKYVIWSDKVTSLYGHKLEGKEPIGTMFFRYRQKGTEEWSEPIASTFDGTYYKSSEIKGLKPGTTYQYQMLEDIKPSNVICEFTTDAVHVLDNNSFEETSYDGKILRISKDPKKFWWDSGNKGSSQMSVNVTDVDGSIYHSGKQSLKLKSQFVGITIINPIGKFAAGNLFVGEFIGTEETYYGILGWGRPFSGRPYGLRAWVKYEPGTVDYTETDKINKGDRDKGIIYIAVGDWTGNDSQYPQWPYVVRTLGPKLFDPKDSGTIGYGEVIFEDKVLPDNGAMMKEVIIPIDYENYGGYERLPKSIIIVASASQYGDYYSGSTGSTMWLDDLELIYDESELSK